MRTSHQVLQERYMRWLLRPIPIRRVTFPLFELDAVPTIPNALRVYGV